MAKKKTKLRPFGDIWLDMEPFILEMFEAHDIQHGDFLGQMDYYLQSHLPGYREKYLDGTSPMFYYGPKEHLPPKGRAKKRK